MATRRSVWPRLALQLQAGMKVVLSARIEADIANQLQYGIDRFGQLVAERTFARVDTFLLKSSSRPSLLGQVPR